LDVAVAVALTLPQEGRPLMRLCRAARRSANQGWRVDHSCGSSSAATAVGWSATSAIAAIVRFVVMASSRGALAARDAIACAGGPPRGPTAPKPEADPSRFLAVEPLAEDDRRHRGLRAGGPAEHPRVAATRVQAELQEAGVEPRPSRREADVTPEGEIHSGAD